MTEQNLDGTGMIFGRLASYVAKRSLLGETVNIYNCEEIIMTGNKAYLLQNYPKKAKFTGQMGKGPFRPRRSDLFLKRNIRNMVPYESARGRAALKRIKFFLGAPQDNRPLTVLEHAHMKRLTTQKYLKIKDLTRLLGGKA